MTANLGQPEVVVMQARQYRESFWQTTSQVRVRCLIQFTQPLAIAKPGRPFIHPNGLETEKVVCTQNIQQIPIAGLAFRHGLVSILQEIC